MEIEIEMQHILFKLNNIFFPKLKMINVVITTILGIYFGIIAVNDFYGDNYLYRSLSYVLSFALIPPSYIYKYIQKRVDYRNVKYYRKLYSIRGRVIAIPLYDGDILLLECYLSDNTVIHTQIAEPSSVVIPRILSEGDEKLISNAILPKGLWIT